MNKSLSLAALSIANGGKFGQTISGYGTVTPLLRLKINRYGAEPGELLPPISSLFNTNGVHAKPLSLHKRQKGGNL